MNENRWLALIIALFILLGMTYALSTPVFEASDELWHYPMIRHLADGNPLPVQVFDPALAGPWNQEASQPPLYYYLGAALTFWIDASDMETIRWQNPHVNSGEITVDGNRNLTIHDPAWNPWQGTLLAVRIVRLFSVLLGAATVYLTYLIAKETVPTRPDIALGAAAVNAFLPMFIFISGAVNNDNLAIPLASLTLLLLIRIVGKERAITGQTKTGNCLRDRRYWSHWLLIGVVIGLALLTKEGTFGLLPLAWGTAFVSLWQGEVGRGNTAVLTIKQLIIILGKAIFVFLIMLIPVLLIAGWWYYRNLVLYGDWLGWNAFIAVLGQRGHPASIVQLWSERQGFMMAFWGLFGGVNVPMPMWIYTLLNIVLILSVFGFILYLIQTIRRWIKQSPISNLQSLIPNLLAFTAHYFGLIINLLFAAAVVYGLITWATTTWSSQGRLVFTALSSLCLLLVIGLVGWLPKRPSRFILLGLAGFMFTVAALAPFLWIAPTYQAPVYAAPPEREGVQFANGLRLLGYDISATELQAGDVIDVTLEWEVTEQMDRDWSIFVHLSDPVLGRPIAQRDMFHGQGLRPTSLLNVGERVTTRHRLQLPNTAIAPAELQLNVGLYDFATCPICERLSVVDAGLLPVDAEAVTIGDVGLTAVSGTTPNPISVNFEKGFELVGYELNPRQTTGDETVDLTLYWRLNTPIRDDYTFFAQLVDAQTTRWASQDLPIPTAQWAVGDVIPVPMQLTVRADTPADVYPIIIGLYILSDEGEFVRLQRITEEGRLTDDFLELTLLRVD